MTPVPFSPGMLAWLDNVETTPYWRAADLPRMRMALADAAARYGMTNHQLALVFIDMSIKMNRVVQGEQEQVALDDEIEELMAGTWEPPGDEDEHSCEIGIRAASFGVQLAVLAAVATREERGRPPV